MISTARARARAASQPGRGGGAHRAARPLRVEADLHACEQPARGGQSVRGAAALRDRRPAQLHAVRREVAGASRLRRGRGDVPRPARRALAERDHLGRVRRGQDRVGQEVPPVPGLRRDAWRRRDDRRGQAGAARHRHVAPDGGLRKRADGDEQQLVALRQIPHAAVRPEWQDHGRVDQDLPPREGAHRRAGSGRAQLPHVLLPRRRRAARPPRRAAPRRPAAATPAPRRPSSSLSACAFAAPLLRARAAPASPSQAPRRRSAPSSNWGRRATINTSPASRARRARSTAAATRLCSPASKRPWRRSASTRRRCSGCGPS